MTYRDETRIKAHYDIEVGLAERLLTATRDERLKLYPAVYDELFARVSDHPQLSPGAQGLSAQKAKEKWRLVRRFVNAKTRLLEIGMGDGVFSALASATVQSITSLEVSEKIIQTAVVPKKVHVLLTNGIDIPVPPESIDVAYSNQVMEHLHPDDAKEQLVNIAVAIRSGGYYICMTPNRLSGPHDVSSHYDLEARGLHLKEYTFTELSALFTAAGFRHVRTYWGGRGIYIQCPASLVRMVECLLFLLPKTMRRPIARLYPIRALLGMQIVGEK